MTWLTLSEDIAAEFTEAQEIADPVREHYVSEQLSLRFVATRNDPEANRRAFARWYERHKGDEKLRARRRRAAASAHARRKADPVKYAQWKARMALRDQSKKGAAHA